MSKISVNRDALDRFYQNDGEIVIKPKKFKLFRTTKVRIISSVVALTIAIGSVLAGFSLTSCKHKDTKDTDNTAVEETTVDGNLIDISSILFNSPLLKSSEYSGSGAYYGKTTGDVDVNQIVKGKDGSLYVDAKSAKEAEKIPAGKTKVVTYDKPGVVEGAPNGGVYDSQASANKIKEAKNNGTYIDPSNVHQDADGTWVLNSSEPVVKSSVAVSVEESATVESVQTVETNNTIETIVVEANQSAPQLYYDRLGNAYFTQADADAANRALDENNYYEQDASGQYRLVR